MQKRNEYRSKPYARRVLISLDQTLNAILGGNPDMTISGRIGWRIVTKKATKIEFAFCKFLRLFENEHCKKSIELDEIREGYDLEEDYLLKHFKDKSNHYLYTKKESELLARNETANGSYFIKMKNGSLLQVQDGETIVYNIKNKRIRKEIDV